GSRMHRRRAKRPDRGTFSRRPRRTGMKRLAVLLLALVLAACGARAAGPGSSPTPTPTDTVSGTNGPFHAEASPARLAAGGTGHLTLTVAGPIDYEIGCVQTVRTWAEDCQRQQAG